MFIGREKELNILSEQLVREDKTAVLVYGKRRVGKSTLIKEAARNFQGIVIDHLCVQSSYAGNLELLYRSASKALGLPMLKFDYIYDFFEFLEKCGQKILLILDEYQYLKNSLKHNEMDSYLQAIIDNLSANVKIILCGSYISIMKELLLEGNPLFGRFTAILHVDEFDYYDAARFFPGADEQKKIELYAVFGGSPYVLAHLDAACSVEENIEKNLVEQTSLFRSYIENVALREIQKAFDIRIFEMIGNGKKKYSEIKSGLSGEDNGLLDKQLKSLMDMEAIEKIFPINRKGDKKKQFYTIKDNLMRFYFTFIFGNDSLISKLGEKAFYRQEIAPKLKTFVSLRFEDIVCQYFRRCVKNGLLQDVYDYGSYWYDDPATKTNGQFDCVLKRADGYDFYECKFYEQPMTRQECEKEEKQLREIRGITCRKMGFVCLAGFDFESAGYHLITAGELYGI